MGNLFSSTFSNENTNNKLTKKYCRLSLFHIGSSYLTNEKNSRCSHVQVEVNHKHSQACINISLFNWVWRMEYMLVECRHERATQSLPSQHTPICHNEPFTTKNKSHGGNLHVSSHICPCIFFVHYMCFQCWLINQYVRINAFHDSMK